MYCMCAYTCVTCLLGLYRFSVRKWWVSMSSSTLAPGMLSITWRSRHTPLPFSRLQHSERRANFDAIVRLKHTGETKLWRWRFTRHRNNQSLLFLFGIIFVRMTKQKGSNRLWLCDSQVVGDVGKRRSAGHGGQRQPGRGQHVPALHAHTHSREDSRRHPPSKWGLLHPLYLVNDTDGVPDVDLLIRLP